MKERPILFSAPMVRAILEGRKTMTRRTIRIPKCNTPEDVFLTLLLEGLSKGAISCPYGKVGDRLWVRETFCDRDSEGFLIKPIYRANEQEYEDADGWYFEPKWIPSIFMPKKYSRITLEITNVRVEQLQDISEADAKAEGCDHFIIRDRLTSYVDDYKNLWNRINGPGSWDANPWVWVIEFIRV